ncbi:MAG: hypothetical protein ACPLKX_08860 [Dictyoglomaceae bacterium]
MDELIVCPECGNPSIEVYYETVKNLTIKDSIPETDWFLCTNPTCKVVYFSDKDLIKKDELKVPVWFKEEDKENVPICYCANITYKEIREGVKIGHKSIKSIRNYLNKTNSGMCKYKNPTGRCCAGLFNYCIKTSI